MKIEEFIKEIEQLGIKYTKEMLDQLELYCDYLLEYNKHTNLTAIRNKEDVYLKHFYDSLTLVKVIHLDEIHSFVDIGSGAGFPGIVLKIFFPHLHGVLIDSNNKKTAFLKNVVDKLELINMEIVNDRVEHYSITHLNVFDLVTARAVTNMRVLAELALPLVKLNGVFVAMKAKSDEELKEAMDTIEIMGGKVLLNNQFSLLIENADRSLIKIEKTRNTLSNEIRPYEKVIKKPLQKNGK